MSGNGQGIEEIPQGVPGRIYICEWCGKYWNNWVPYGEMKFCPSCGKAALRKDCSKCGTPIPFPPQWKCFACGEWLTLMPMHEVKEGQFVHSGDVVREPDAEHRKQLESKGNNWLDVVKGKAEGPDPDLPDVPPPAGWTPEDFARLMQQAKAQIPEEGKPSEQTVYCQHCKVKLRYFGVKEQIADVRCIICNGPIVEYPFVEEEPGEEPETDQGLDNPAAGG